MRKSARELKSVQMSFRMTESFRDALATLADKDMRSQAGMLEIIMRDYLERHPIEPPVGKTGVASKSKKNRR